MGNTSHRWFRAGGCKENPGVWSVGAFMLYREECALCGTVRTKRTCIVKFPNAMQKRECHGWRYEEQGRGPGNCTGTQARYL